RPRQDHVRRETVLAGQGRSTWLCYDRRPVHPAQAAAMPHDVHTSIKFPCAVVCLRHLPVRKRESARTGTCFPNPESRFSAAERLVIPNPARRRARGFTLIEILVVVVILGILAAIVVPRVMERPGEARIVRVKQDLQGVTTALSMYKLDNHRYPSSEQGLQAL